MSSMAPVLAITKMVAGLVLNKDRGRPRWGECVSFAERGRATLNATWRVQ
jgi:hypothetical protein